MTGTFHVAVCVPQAASFIRRQCRRQRPKLTGGSLPAVASTSAPRAQGWLLAPYPRQLMGTTSKHVCHHLLYPPAPLTRPAHSQTCLPVTKGQTTTSHPGPLRKTPPACSDCIPARDVFSDTLVQGGGLAVCPHCPRTAGRLVGVRSAGGGVFQECRWWPHQQALNDTT